MGVAASSFHHASVVVANVVCVAFEVVGETDPERPFRLDDVRSELAAYVWTSLGSIVARR